MSNSRTRRQEKEQVAYSDQTLLYADDSADTGQTLDIEPWRATVRIRLSNAGAPTLTAKLPSVAHHAGPIEVVLDVLGGTGVVTLTDHDNDAVDWSDLTLDTLNDRVVLKSNGTSWAILENQIA